MARCLIGAVVMSGAIVGLGCGRSNVSTVASVQGVAISRASVAHRMSIENARSQSTSVQIPVPDPPGYSRCIVAASAAQVQLKSRQRQLSRQELRQRCAQVYVELKQKALAFLITADWLEGEAAVQGIRVLPSEVDASYRQLLNNPAGPGFASRLRRAGVSTTDELLQLRLEKLAERLRNKLTAGYNAVSPAQIAAYYHSHASEFAVAGHRHQTLAAATPTIRQKLLHAARERRVGAFIAEYRQRWKQRTTCQQAYIVDECRDGPSLPASPTK
jgi:foldase protein PrsA